MITEILNIAEQYAWGIPSVVMLIGTGVVFMLLLRGLPIRMLPEAIRMAVGITNNKSSEKNHKKQPEKEITDRKHTNDDDARHVSPMKALATELATTIGTGNIIGVTGAMTIGGPGALFWMFLSCIPGLATKLVESTMSVSYRMKDQKGEYLGGPMVTLVHAFPYKRMGRILGMIYCIFAILCAFGMGNMVQANAISVSAGNALGIAPITCGILLAMITIIVIMGGTGRITDFCMILVPVMGMLYIGGCIGVILMNIEHLLPALRLIVIGAFCPKAVCGGLFGTVSCTAGRCIICGVSRGVFSNEAGLGASGISASGTGAKAVVQGYISMTGVFFDTAIICLLTGIAIACSGVMGMASLGQCRLMNGITVKEGDAAGLVLAAFEGCYGRYGVILLSVCIILFAFATIIGWAYQGEKVWRFLTKCKATGIYRMIYGICVLPGAIFPLEIVWTLSNICNALLMIPNLVCLFVMGPDICDMIRKFDFDDAKRTGDSR